MNDFEQIPLKDIHLPNPVSWWPPAPGWWALLIIAAATCFALWWWIRKTVVRRQRRAVRIAARVELDRIENEYQRSRDAGETLQQLSILVRRVGMSVERRERVAGLCGEAWANWLKQSVPPGSSTALMASLTEEPYRQSNEVDVSALVRACRDWLESVTRRQVTS